MPGAEMVASNVRALNETIFNDLVRWAEKSPRQLDSLYESSYAVHCVFRALPPIARLYITRMIYVTPPSTNITIEGLRGCLRRRQRAQDRHELAIRAMKAFRILAHDVDRDSSANNQGTGISIHSGFAAQLRASITGQMQPVFGGTVDESTYSTQNNRIPDIEALDKFSAGRLEKILNFLVESSGNNAPRNSILQALIQTSILEDRRDGLCITSSGFQFLLKDSFSQVWVLLRSIINTQHQRLEFDVLDFIFKLSFSQVGSLYFDSYLSKVCPSFLESLDELGVIYLEDDHHFRPTTVGKQLLTSASRISSGSASISSISKLGPSASATGDIEIVVETNFRVYAYTTSAFQMNLIGLFTHLRYRLPNLVVCHLTRDAVRRALMNGISADQIIAYLNAHAHPRMKKGCIPSNVSDEIRLWEGEQERVQTTKGTLLSDFSSQESYNQALLYADEIGARLWASPRDRKFIVSADSADAIKSYIKGQGII